ncbi:RNA-directed DNA polymerase [Tabrizicola thermarum]|uniref:RNA-directed DNA polymerase n=1 Tax=Tabrizicola thermarum TaxID=2670345 RepID=UPI000FFB136E|nr:RNA-directed DNA polymerase [Tabrizicola thermarum]
MNKTERLKLLLEKGHFPAELPPPFNTADFAKYRKSLAAAWPNNDPPKTAPEVYNTQRLGWKRRSLAIVNPISQYHLSKTIADNWIAIKTFLDTSKISLDSANLVKEATRAVPKPDFSRIEFMKLNAGGDFDHILISDISRFYGTIYTHTLPWAFTGKAWCKSHVNSPLLKATIGDQLDRAVRKGQDNQTIGIPIGPDTSRILSEIVAIGIEREFLRLANPEIGSAYRFVDDWFIGHNSAQAAESAIRFLAEACAEFELELNLEKTSVINAKDEIVEVWPNELLELVVNHTKASEQARQLNRFFPKAFSLAKEKPGSNVMDYALKASRSFRIGKDTYPLFESYILRSARAYPITLPTVVQILVNYKKDRAPVNLARCKKLIVDEIKRSAPLRHTAEVSWALFLAKALGIAIPSLELDVIVRTDNATWALLVLDLEQRGLIDGVLDKTYWTSLMVDGSLYTANWLLVYEADLKGWLTPADPNLISNNPWFKPLKAKKVSFYDTNRNVETFKKSRSTSISAAKIRRAVTQSWLEAFLRTSSIPPSEVAAP